MTSTKQMYVGKSLSMCVKDILIGNVKLDEVLRIESGTKIDTVIELVELTIDYYDRYWKDVEDTGLSDCYNIVNHLLFHNKLHQERVIEGIDNHLERSLDLHYKIATSVPFPSSNDVNWWDVVNVEYDDEDKNLLISDGHEVWKTKVGIRTNE